MVYLDNNQYLDKQEGLLPTDVEAAVTIQNTSIRIEYSILWKDDIDPSSAV